MELSIKSYEHARDLDDASVNDCRSVGQ
ncbi:MAG: hypothetical protein RLZZ478_461, partial [Actinomycetota bacterium]